MAPKSLTISRLALEISADDESARSLLCLKVSILRDQDAKQTGRWSLFGDTAPHLASAPQIYSLPLSVVVAQTSGLIRTASNLLSLTFESSQVSNSSRSARPTIEVNPHTGRIEVSVESTGSHNGQTGSSVSSSPGGNSSGGARREFLVILEYDHMVEMADGKYQLCVALPKCLDNNLRFQILPARSSTSTSSGEVSIVTEPKILPSSRSPRAVSSVPKFRTRNRSLKEDGWEDGESLGPEDLDSESSDDEGEGSWLDGRFQSTDTLRLEWSYASSMPSYPALHVIPSWHTRHPSIQVEYTASISGSASIGLEAEIPHGWGWSELAIQGDDLLSWHCTDGQWWDPLLSSSSTCAQHPDISNSTEPDEDSFSTVRARRDLSNTSQVLPSLSRPPSGASLMRQPLPQPDPSFDEFSFELNSAPAPLTPTSLRKRSILSQSKIKLEIPTVVLSRPAPGCSFELVFADHMEDPDIRITGKLVPLTKTLLVSPSIPVITPVFRLAEDDGQCQYSTPTHTSSLINTNEPPTLAWTNQQGHPIALPSQVLVNGNMELSIKRSSGSSRIMSLTFPWPKWGQEVSIQLSSADTVPKGLISIKRVSMRGRALPRNLGRKDGGYKIQIGKGEGVEGICVVELEVDDEYFEYHWDLPILEEAVGIITLDLSESSWKPSQIRTNLTQTSPLTYSATLPPSSPLRVDLLPHTQTTHRPHPIKPSSNIWGIWSWSTLINIVMLYLLLSLGQQLQRLHSQVAFISEENTDLRAHTARLQDELGRYGQYTRERVGSEKTSSPDNDIYSSYDRPNDGLAGAEFPWNGYRPERNDHGETSIGRIVLGGNVWSWQTLIRHPTMTTIGRSLGWMWQTVVWLIHA